MHRPQNQYHSCCCLAARVRPVCRLSVYKQFKEGQKRVLVATDLIGRGIDIERVNIVINYDMPETDDRKGNGADTYLHRVRLPLYPDSCQLTCEPEAAIEQLS